MKYIAIVLLTLSATACNGELSQINKTLESMNYALEGKLASSPPKPMGKINLILASDISDNNLKKALEEAKENISGFLKINSCIKGHDGSLLNRYAAPGKVFSNYSYTKAPIPTTKYHNKNTCMSIRDISSVQLLSKNALYFDVVYISESSGESIKFNHTLVKQQDSEWLFIK